MSRTETRKFHIIQPVVVNQKTRSPSRASRCRYIFLRCSSRIPPCPCTIALGSPVVPARVEDPQRVVERHRLELERAVPEEAVLPAAAVEVAERDRLGRRSPRAIAATVGAPVEVLAAVAVAVDREQHLRLDLREAVDHAAAAELGRRRRPDRAERGRGEERRDRLRDVRQVGRDAVAAARRRARPAPRGSPPCARAARPTSTSPSARDSDAWRIATRSPGLPRNRRSA